MWLFSNGEISPVVHVFCGYTEDGPWRQRVLGCQNRLYAQALVLLFYGEPHWTLSHLSVQEQGRRGGRYILKSLCDEA